MKKEQLFNTEAMLGEERRRNAELREKLVRRGTTVLVSTCGGAREPRARRLAATILIVSISLPRSRRTSLLVRCKRTQTLGGKENERPDAERHEADGGGAPDDKERTAHARRREPDRDQDDGIELDLNPEVPEAARDASPSHVEEEDADEPGRLLGHARRASRRSSIGAIDYSEPSLRSKLRRGFKHTFGLDDSDRGGR